MISNDERASRLERRSVADRRLPTDGCGPPVGPFDHTAQQIAGPPIGSLAGGPPARLDVVGWARRGLVDGLDLGAPHFGDGDGGAGSDVGEEFRKANFP